ncbi:MAG: glycerophosphodiester phosphodiesterase [Oceanospirillaceae bacterium]|jgi:glycerophosphoryl diester phosphodiesterase|nr:glycerophosphodiester phosphodiesterase [Oceanospirillaceae bacterium]MBT4442493.1 glycerophosphodiester phosphodiesterase [Oceanospirillaceae bacterium]MBT6076582.1 glycerophosphodiester phosphodiesterase [Oceanospirillaceae bacterium]MBT7329627.1 glycerophosphodiester phosphodiesterase [Oceanospirillaceae bacterium]
MQLFAHRGISDLAPENSMAAFELALAQGADGIELDVRLMSGQVVVMHDASVDRTTNGTGLVSQFNHNQWQGLDAGDGNPPPTLRQVLAFVAGRCEVNIELKSVDLVPQVATEITNAVEHLGFGLTQLCVSAFDHRLLVQLTALLPKVAIAPLIASCPVSLAAMAADMDAQAIHCHTETTDMDLVGDAHNKGLKIRVYTVTLAVDLLRLRQIGVDAVFVNDVEWARSILNENV